MEAEIFTFQEYVSQNNLRSKVKSPKANKNTKTTGIL